MHGPDVGAPATAGGAGYGELVLTSLLVLVLVCVVAWAVLRVLGKWLEGRRVGTGVTVVGRVPLEPRRSLFVVEAGGRRLLLGSSEGAITMLTELPAEPAAADGAASARARGFGELVAQAIAARVRRRPAGAPVGAGAADVAVTMPANGVVTGVVTMAMPANGVVTMATPARDAGTSAVASDVGAGADAAVGRATTAPFAAPRDAA